MNIASQDHVVRRGERVCDAQIRYRQYLLQKSVLEDMYPFRSQGGVYTLLVRWMDFYNQIQFFLPINRFDVLYNSKPMVRLFFLSHSAVIPMTMKTEWNN